jgi:hypothetical protein
VLKVCPNRVDVLGMVTPIAPNPRCPSCHTAVVQIQLGTGSVLCSCSRCDRRWWLTDGIPADLGAVLAGVADSDARRRLRVAS